MPTSTSRGFPLYSDTDSMPAWNTGYNAHSNALETALDEQEVTIKGWATVATVADLPVTDNWTGRLIYVQEDDRLRRWSGTQWGVIGFPPSIFTEPAIGSGWDTPSINQLYQRSGWVQLTFNARRTSAAAVGAVIAEVPVGYRGNHNVFAMAGRFDASVNPIDPILCYYDWITEEVKLRSPMASGTYVALTIGWPLEGAT